MEKAKPFTERLEAFTIDLQKIMKKHRVGLKEQPVIKPDGTIGAEVKVIDLIPQDGTAKK